MMKKLIELLGWNEKCGCFDGRIKEVEYRYVFLVQEGGTAVYAVCVGLNNEWKMKPAS